ncbi:MAG: hypothetical protein VX733_03260 [Candidatus Latescibacterota bacterium]|nr:hypothetical protein [Candidatus Latescibacterota bacterium]
MASLSTLTLMHYEASRLAAIKGCFLSAGLANKGVLGPEQNG